MLPDPVPTSSCTGPLTESLRSKDPSSAAKTSEGSRMAAAMTVARNRRGFMAKFLRRERRKVRRKRCSFLGSLPQLELLQVIAQRPLADSHALGGELLDPLRSLERPPYGLALDPVHVVPEAHRREPVRLRGAAGREGKLAEADDRSA